MAALTASGGAELSGTVGLVDGTALLRSDVKAADCSLDTTANLHPPSFIHLTARCVVHTENTTTIPTVLQTVDDTNVSSYQLGRPSEAILIW